MAYAVQLAPAAIDRLRAMPADLQDLTERRLTRLSDEPRPAEAACLDRDRAIYRLRLADLAITYRVYESLNLVYVVRIRQR
jgi:mRNA-degrading endonuclease RelE of RelBE toxin-antitoxin system